MTRTPKQKKWIKEWLCNIPTRVVAGLHMIFPHSESSSSSSIPYLSKRQTSYWIIVRSSDKVNYECNYFSEKLIKIALNCQIGIAESQRDFVKIMNRNHKQLKRRVI